MPGDLPTLYCLISPNLISIPTQIASITRSCPNVINPRQCLFASKMSALRHYIHVFNKSLDGSKVLISLMNAFTKNQRHLLINQITDFFKLLSSALVRNERTRPFQAHLTSDGWVLDSARLQKINCKDWGDRLIGYLFAST